MASLSVEEENYVRLSLLLIGVSPRAVRSFFDGQFPPTSLQATLKTNHKTLHDLYLKRILSQTQKNLLNPGHGMLFLDKDHRTF